MIEMTSLLDEIKDDRLKGLLEEYKEKQNTLLFLMILDYKNIKISKERIDGIIIQYLELDDENIIELGGIILCGVFYKITFDIDSQTLGFYQASGLEVE